MTLVNVTHIVIYRPYRQAANSTCQYALFTDAREAMSFSGSHSRYCSTMELCKVDFQLTEDVLNQILQTN